MPPESDSQRASQPGWRTHRAQLLWVLGALIVAIIVVIIWVLVEPSFFTNLFSGKHVQKTALPGTVVLDFSQPWQAPDTEQLYGMVTYNPTSNAFSNLVAPQLQFSPIPYENVVSPDGTLVLGMQSDGKTTSLVTYSLPQQKVISTLDTQPIGTVFSNPVWAPDGSHIAYRTIQLPPPNTPMASSTSAQGPKSSSYIVAKDGSNKTSLGDFLIPAMISPDESAVLVVGGPNIFEIAVLPTGNATTTQISTISRADTEAGGAGPMLFDPTGKHLAILNRNTGVTVYSIDWKGQKLLRIDAEKNFPNAAVFGTDGELLTLNFAAHQADAYYFYSTGEGVRINTYPFTLPGSALLLRWSPSAK